MQKTQNYQLNQYEPQDNFLRTDFNADNQKIDTALKALGDKTDTKADQTALDQTNNAVFMATVVSGHYEGDYQSGVSPYYRVVELGFRPRAVLVMPAVHHSYSDYAASIFLTVEGADTNALTITDTGFRVGPELNQKDKTTSDAYPWSPYRYLAWR